MRILPQQPNYTQYNSSVIQQTPFQHTVIKNQPDTPIYKQQKAPDQWWRRGLLDLVMGITAYYNFASEYGLGFYEKVLDKKVVPRIIDRSSPFMWL